MSRVPFAIYDNVFEYYDYDNNNYDFTSATLYVPKGTKAKYEATDGWNNFSTIFELGSGTPSTAGDVNGDEGVDVGNVMAVINYMAGQSTLSKEQTDVNGDGSVDVDDVMAIINLMPGGNKTLWQ